MSKPVKGVEALVLVDGITGRVGDADTRSQAVLKGHLKLDCCLEFLFLKLSQGSCAYLLRSTVEVISEASHFRSFRGGRGFQVKQVGIRL